MTTCLLGVVTYKESQENLQDFVIKLKKDLKTNKGMIQKYCLFWLTVTKIHYTTLFSI